jgi:hypothetical protein
METKKSSQPTWETVRYMVAQIQYGGRITDDLDQLLMNTYSERFFNQVITMSPSLTHTRPGYAAPFLRIIVLWRLCRYVGNF